MDSDAVFWSWMLFWACIWSVVTLLIAQHKKIGNYFAWWFVGLFLGLIAVIAVAFQPAKNPDDNMTKTRCPYCHEIIIATAYICKHCGKQVRHYPTNQQ